MKMGASGRAASTLFATLMGSALLAATPAVSDPMSSHSESAEPFATAQTGAANPGISATDQAGPPAGAESIGAESKVLEADQLNDLDVAASQAEHAINPETAAHRSASAQPKAELAVAKSDSTWDQTSVVGKIFIGFGGLLTLASAARMLIG